MLVGLVLVLIGIYFLMKVLVPGFDFDLSWGIIWPIILIVLGVNNLFKFKKLDIFNIVLIIIGVIYLLLGLNVISNVNYKIIVAIIFIGIGISIITASFKNKKIKEISKSINVNKEGIITYNGIFSGIEEKINDEDFKGANCYAIFGGVELDLRDAKLKNDVVINCYSVFGGIDLLIPDDVNIVVNSGSLFGGVENKTNNKNNFKNKTIYVNATAIFGGVDLK